MDSTSTPNGVAAAAAESAAPPAHSQACPVRNQGLLNQRVVLARIAAFEAEHGVRVIFAAESSSRTIGTAHDKSDHDVVAIYVHRRDRYFSMQKIPTAVKKTWLEQNDGREPEVELVAWEARHAFGLLADSTLALLDAFYSPLIYIAEDIPFDAPPLVLPRASPDRERVPEMEANASAAGAAGPPAAVGSSGGGGGGGGAPPRADASTSTSEVAGAARPPAVVVLPAWVVSVQVCLSVLSRSPRLGAQPPVASTQGRVPRSPSAHLLECRDSQCADLP
jgi:hypothetical protein